MSFFSLEPFFMAKNSLEFLSVQALFKRKSVKYCTYRFENENKKFEYIGVLDNLFCENDEVIVASRDNKIILFKNFTQNTDNFKEAFLRALLFMIMLFSACAVFLYFCIAHSFAGIDLGFFVLFFLGFVLSLNNFLKIKKQISILAASSKKEIQDFLQKDKI